MILIFLFFAFLFVVAILSGLVITIIASINKSRLRKLLNQNHPEINHNLGLSEFNFGKTLGIKSSKSFLNLFLSFGSKKLSKEFWKSFVDVEAVYETNDEVAKVLVTKSINLMSLYVKVWITGMLMLLIAFITFSLS